ncbi:MAG TPA: branched-chain amino acid ABC transporter permease [Clostridia bacterium]|nr:branched-chain amino acid ABC transporter permease [Clostridia bacterium]
MRVVKNKYLQYLLVGVLFALPAIIPGVSTSTITMLGSIVYIAIAGIGVNVLLGFSGQVSLGHAAFMGLSAYMSAYLTKQLEWPFIPALIVAVLAPLLIGLVLGAIAVRLEGLYLAIATLGFGEILRQLFIEMDWFTGGFSGAAASHSVIFGHKFTKPEMYLFMVALMVLLMILVYNMMRSSTGRAMIAMKSSQHAAQAMGVNIFKYKLLSFAISAIFAGIAGVCYVHFFTRTDPTRWTAVLSLDLIAVVVIGGAGTIGGAVVGAVMFNGLSELIKEIPIIGEMPGMSLLIYGILMIIVLMFYPRGLINIPGGIAMWFQKRKAAAKVALKKEV